LQEGRYAMKFAESRTWGLAKFGHGEGTAWNRAALVLGALITAWPAFYNGFPLIYPDTMTYVDDGGIVARALLLHQKSSYYGIRSFFYSLGILPLHWNVTLWPIVALQCLLTAYIVWLVVRSIVPHKTISAYLAMVVTLSLVTGMSWYATLIMPDILGPLLYLSIYLLLFARDSLTRAERLTLYPIAVWAIVSHATHMMLAAGLCVMLALPLLWNRREFRRRLRPLCEVAAMIALAAAAQFSLNDYLYGKPSLNGERPPFLTARIIADGPGRWYLEKHCGQLNWVICDHVRSLTDDPDNFLWAPDGIYQKASDWDSEQLVKEEIPFVLATLRAYPRDQIEISAVNFREQLTAFGLEDLDASSWVLDQFDTVLPRARAGYVKSRQARNAIPLGLLTSIQFRAVTVSVGIIAVFGVLLWRRGSRRPYSSRILGLGMVIVSIVIANALITGTLSMVEDRLECRVIWLIPLLAGMCVLDWWSGRRELLAGAHLIAGPRRSAADSPLGIETGMAGKNHLNEERGYEALAASLGLTRSRSSFEGLK
jgi:hypothetical protein